MPQCGPPSMPQSNGIAFTTVLIVVATLGLAALLGTPAARRP